MFICFFLRPKLSSHVLHKKVVENTFVQSQLKLKSCVCVLQGVRANNTEKLIAVQFN